MVRQTTHKEKTRARILDEAAKAMRLHGYTGISVADLMKRAGLTHGGFYVHFSSREELVAHAIDRMFEDSAAFVRHFLGGDGGVADLAGLIDFYLSERTMDQVEVACPLPGLSGEASRLPDLARHRFEAGMDRFRSAIASALARSGHADEEVLASSILAEMVGAMAMARAHTDRTSALALLKGVRDRIKDRVRLKA